MSVKDARVTLRVDEGALNTVKALAEKEQRTVSQMLRVLLIEALRARVGR